MDDLIRRAMQVFLNGLISGLAIALMALAFQLVYLPTRVFFVGIAGLYTVAPYAYLAIHTSCGNVILSSIGSLLIVSLLAVLFEWINHGPLFQKGASDGAHLISSLGMYIVVVEGVAIIWGNSSQTLRTGVDFTVQALGVVLTKSQLLIASVAVVALAAFVGMLQMTNLGLRLRALSANPTQFALYGYNVKRYRLFAFGLAGLLTAATSLVAAFDVDFNPHLGLPAMLLAVVAVISGGRSSFVGPVLGGLLIGVLRAEVVWYVSSRWQDAVTFAVLALFVVFRPQGLLGGRSGLELRAI
jgi:branched-chain amino acid transport system permease protein